MSRPRALITITFAVFLTGCRTVFVMSEAEMFFRHHPEQRVSYARLCQVDVELLKEQAFLRDAIRRDATEFVRQRLGADTNVRAELESKRRIDEQFYEEDLKTIRSLEQALASHGGQVYFFEREQPVANDKRQMMSEEGYLVLSGGGITATAGVVRSIRSIRGEAE